jgi:HIV Tat-specific factor 1
MVYVSNLPLDVTEEEFLDVMRNGGVVMRDPGTGTMKIKLYTEPGSSQLKGDGLCTYIRVNNFTDMLYMRLWLDDIL